MQFARIAGKGDYKKALAAFRAPSRATNSTATTAAAKTTVDDHDDAHDHDDGAHDDDVSDEEADDGDAEKETANGIATTGAAGEGGNGKTHSTALNGSGEPRRRICIGLHTAVDGFACSDAQQPSNM